MTPGFNRTPSRRVLTGLLCAALVAWVLLLEQIFSQLTRAGGPRPDMWQEVWGVLVLFAVFGLPLALIFTLAIGYPAWRLAERLGFATIRSGALWGAICGTIIAALKTADTVLLASPGTSYGGSDGYAMIDGQLTALGWAGEFETMVLLAVAGAGAGLVAVWVARRG